jgi:hypothetical protein
MHIRAATRGRRFICVKPLRSVGLDGGTKSFKDKDLTLGTPSNWPLVMLNYGL